MPLYLAPTPTAAATTTLLPRPQLLPSPPPPPPPSIDLRRLERGVMAFPPPPSPPPPPLLSASNSHITRAKQKAVVVLGATGTGKSRLAVDLALHFGGEVINSDKIQLHAGLPVTTNKVTAHERAGVPHHLLGVAAPDAELTPSDFRRAANLAARAVTARGRVPVVAGGSNTFVEELVDGGDDGGAFRDRYDCCFLWIDVRRAVLHGYVDRRVDEMLARGLVDEVAAAFHARRRRCSGDGDGEEEEEYGYERGIWRAIGVPELDAYLRWSGEDDGERARLLAAAVEEMKGNTRRLACRQRGKIQRLAKKWGNVRRVDATEVFRRRRGGGGADDEEEAWRRVVAAPCIDAVRNFLCNDDGDDDDAGDDLTAAADVVVPVFAPPKQAAAVAG